ncbi:MAG TPA: right-handed parallel beta-helix repeat-containing protein, partial [Gemmataceae bacterium]
MAQFERPPYRPSNRRDDKRKGKRPGGRRVLERLEPLEDRVTPVVTAEAITDTLMVTMDGAGDHAFLSFDGTNVNVDDSAAGGSNKGSFAGITDIIVLDMGTEAGQRATFSGGTAFTQNVTAAGVETIDAFQQIGGTVAGDAAAVNVDDPGQIQDGIAFAAPGAAVNVAAGTFDEDVLLNKPGLRLLGAGPGVTTIRGVIGGDGATVRVGASGVEVAGFTITRLGNNPADWNDPNLNFAGIAVQGAATGMLVHDNLITGNRTGIDVNNSSGHTIRNNVIDFNHTGLIFRNQTDDLVVEENAITNNRTIGVLFLDASFGTNVPPQQALNSRFFNNNISGNWYAQVVDRQAGGNLPAPGTTNLKDFSGNWFGTSTPVITDADTTEPGYASLI